MNKPKQTKMARSCLAEMAERVAEIQAVARERQIELNTLHTARAECERRAEEEAAGREPAEIKTETPDSNIYLFLVHLCTECT